MPRLFSSLLILAMVYPVTIHSKEKSSTFPPLAGEVVGRKIYFEAGRILEWPASGPLTLRDANGAVLATVDLQNRSIKESGTEALGLDVEEVDLGGGGGNSKKYLGGKKAPRGRALSSQALSGKAPLENGQSQTQTVQGIPVTTVTYPNGAILMKWEWPAFREETYFDRRRSFVYSERRRSIAPWELMLLQYGDGSFSRNYQNAQGSLSYTYDANDESYRFSFNNSQQETLLEVSCQETCR